MRPSRAGFVLGLAFAALRDLPRQLVTTCARVAGLPICSACDAFELRGAGYAFASGWRAVTWHDGGQEVLCAHCARLGE